MRLKSLLIVFLLSVSAIAQQPGSNTRNELEQRKKQIMQSIKETEEQLEMTKKNKNVTMGQLHALQNKLNERQRLIGTINEQIGDIDNNIKSSTQEIGQLSQNLQLLKMRYSQSLRYAYENRSAYTTLAYVFSSRDYNDAVRRLKYLKKYRDYRKEQVVEIRITQAKLQHKIGELNSQKAQKDELLTSQVEQKKVLEKETNETNAVVKDLKGQEKQLIAEIEKNRKIAAKVNKAINDIIRREMEMERKKAEEAMRKKAEEDKKKQLASNNTNNNNPRYTTTTTTTTKPGGISVKNDKPGTTTTPKVSHDYNLSMTPEAIALSNNFENNRGKLPWPVEKGFISDAFGQHKHAVYDKLMVYNDGVDIRTSQGATARAVFEGTVTSVFAITGAGWIVLVNHGRYYTVYKNLQSVSVKKGDNVRTKQPIGVVGENDEGDPTINFQIWKSTGNGSSKIDPSPWIAH